MALEWKQPLRRAAAGAVAVVTSASMLVGGIFHTPADLPEESVPLPAPIVLDEDDLDGDGKNKKTSPPENAQTEEPGESEETVTPAEAEPALPEEEKKGLRRWWSALSFRQRLMLIPAAALLGWGLFTLLSLFLPGVIGKIVAWLATLAAFAFGFVATEKAIFPEIPLKKLLRSRNFAGLIVAVVSLGAADFLLPFVWSGYSKVEILFRALGLVLAFTGAGWSFARRTRRETDEEARRAREAAEAEAEEEDIPEEPKPLTREDVLAIADTVSRKRK